ncbi:helix-turn-helix domain-containing protein [Chryseobacterium sp. GMJ5]|uniref:Helix-turn-helix domain-containing protein n=1 Tax=Chryseobacterium gilvum TaxID=2976534 RepID=A0ABT2VVP0_9FLAO|nr:helix-turn-helix transcriptional regulator [Chryseobacterium gilvum]MCU7614058.1 helix-turn-helix domain-containing protein [Chryseobacterium gilvum]
MYAFIILLIISHFCKVNNVRNADLIRIFGDQLKKLRIEKKMSQEELANSSDIPISQIGRIERGEINTTLSTIYAISQALEVNIKELFDFTIEKS